MDKNIKNYSTLDNYDKEEFIIKDTMLKKYIGKGDNVSIPYGITTIGREAFSNCNCITNALLPNSVQYIENSAFFRCCGLKEIIIPKNVVHIGCGVFSGCNSLENIQVSPENKVYHSEENCIIETETKTLISGQGATKIPNYILSIAEDAFACNENLEELTIPSYVANLGEGAFAFCTNLKSIIVLGNITSIDDLAFVGCYNLESILLPNSITNIGRFAFASCLSLKSIILPEGLQCLRDLAFEQCYKLKDIYYKGTKEQWDRVSKGQAWDESLGDYTVHCNDWNIKKHRQQK